MPTKSTKTLRDATVSDSVEERAAIHAEDLQTTFSRVRTESSNDVYVAPSNLLRVWLFSIGNVYYKGNPNVVVETHSGNGQIIRLE